MSKKGSAIPALCGQIYVSALIRRIALRHFRALTTPLPDKFPKSEMGLMTREQFLRFRNPEGKYHESDTFDYDIHTLNPTLLTFRRGQYRGNYYNALVAWPGIPAKGFVIEKDGKVVAVLHGGLLYHSPSLSLTDLNWAFPHSSIPNDEDIPLHEFTPRRVKYPQEYVALVSDGAKRNRSTYSHLLQNLIVKGESYQLRSEGPLERDRGMTLVLLNAKQEIVARASDEWGATLITVAREYRGKGLGQVLGKVWYEWNPSYKSGGFTSAGQENALRLWEERVHEFAARGWYSELVRQGRLSREQVKAILADLKRRPKQVLPDDPIQRPPDPKKELLVFADGVTFVVYDSRFLQNQDEEFLHGYGFMRESNPVGTFYYTIDYDRPFQKYVTEIALQMARDNGETLYIGPGYGDIMELEGIDHIEQDGNYISLTRDLLPLKALAAKERRARRSNDPYDEIQAALLEMAESKWS